MNIAEPPPATTTKTSSASAVRAACALIPPLYNLENFVAVNPFLGWSGVPLAEASARISSGLDAEILPPLAHYREAWKGDKIGFDDLARAAARHGLHTEDLLAKLAEPRAGALPSAPAERLESERVFLQYGIDLPRFIRRFVSRSLADLCSNRPAQFGPPTPNGLYQELLQRASLDKTFDLAGVSGWSKWMKSAPSDYGDAAAWVEAKRSRGLLEPEAYAYRLLGSQYGWASYLRGLGWNSGANELSLLESLCAALLVFDLALSELIPSKTEGEPSTWIAREDDSIRLCLQDAYEDRLTKAQLSAFMDAKSEAKQDRPEFQLLFCIDVRSEVMRRNLEAQSPKVETTGFAGFFGVAVDLVSEEQPSPRCPVLLKPQIEVQAGKPEFSQVLTPALRMAYSSPGAFNLIETFGMGSIGSLLTKALGRFRQIRADESAVAVSGYAANHFGLTLAERVALAESILTNSGIRQRLGRIVVLCGHGGRSTNNSHAASLDCGACGGHCGALNAQMAVEVLNDAEVRDELAKRGFSNIKDSLFVAGQHDTSTDEVSLFQPTHLSKEQSQALAELQQWLAAASEACRAERARFMGIEDTSSKGLLANLELRAGDWSEVRPEWGLARNASFIAAPRSRTRGANLEGRAFLHDYDSSADPDDAILKLILSAPVVVASWINLQYFASTVDNDRFGCGTKALLNRIGKVGVISGNEGDLRPGLPIESVHRPGGEWFHDPVRLQVIVEAPTDKIDRVLEQVPSVADLVRNGWVRLFSLEPQSKTVHLRRMDASWEDWSNMSP